MAGVYGDVMLAFPEQFRTVRVYSMAPRVGAGLDLEGNSKYVRCIFQHREGGRLDESGGNLVKKEKISLWSRTSGLQGMYTKLGGKDVYRIVMEDSWAFEGGYYHYDLVKVVGNNGTESDIVTPNFGADSFA